MHQSKSTIMAVGAALAVALLGGAPAEAQRKARPLDPLYDRVAEDLKKGKPMVITVHVALCDNNIIRCGGRGSGNGDVPRRNLYWGKAGIPAWLTRARGYRRVFSDGGDGDRILERVVLRRRVKRPTYAWRRRGVTRGFDVMSLTRLFPGPFVVDGLVRGLAAGQTQAKVCLRGIQGYANNSKSSVRRLRYTFIHGQERRFKRRFKKPSKSK